jgi:hypothetical protein
MIDPHKVILDGEQSVAWALMQPDSYSVFASRALAEKMRELCAGGDIVPLYRSPTLTDEEREAIEELRILAREHRPNSDRVKGYSYTVERFLRRTK